MNILFLKGFNNYFNRTVKKYSTLADYKSNSASFLDYASINFNPNDGVATELVVGGKLQQELNGANSVPLTWEESGTPDYCVVYESNGSLFHPSGTIKSRWFILESQRVRNGQYRLALKRDIIADYLNEILTAPCFVEKGCINNNGDPMLFNNENISVNQIKQSELLLKDKTGCGWIVGYVSQDKTRYPTSDYYESTSPVATVESWSSVPQGIKDLIALGTFQRPVARINTSWGVPAGRCYINAVNWRTQASPAKYQGIGWSNVPWAGEATAGYQAPETTTLPVTNGIVLSGTGFKLSQSNTVPVAAADFAQAVRFNAILREYYVQNILTNGVDFGSSTQDDINAWNGRFVEKDGVVYRIKYTVGPRTLGDPWTIAANSSYYSAFTTEWNSFKTAHAGEVFFRDGNNTISVDNVSIVTNDKVVLAWEINEASVILEETAGDEGYIIKTYMPATRIQACDTPMDLFAIPYSDNFTIYTQVDAETGDPIETGAIKMSKQVALQAAISLGQAGDNVYDIQVLPYFPNPELIEDNEIINEQFIVPYTNLTEDKHYNFIYNDDNTKIGIMFWSRKSVFTVDIEEQLTLADTNPLTLKTSNTCDLFRITSPNYAGSFEFSLAKSGGRIEKFNADCTYKPYSPYIHVTPYLAGLYGENFSTIDDARGLICGGDFSITKIVNQWQQYELQNKNYQAIFDRQIQNLDTNNAIAMEQQDWKNMQSVFGGILGGGAGGAVGGLKSAGPYGAIAGAVLGTAYGTAMSEIGAINQTRWLQRAQAETKDYQTDMYGYQLGNIKALPNALSKTSALTNNNKLFPFVEYFTCTDAEKNAFKDKIKYNGMTVMKVGTLNNYANSSDFDRVYVKGQLIRLDNINDDFHVADAIYQEVNKGFFIPQ